MDEALLRHANGWLGGPTDPVWRALGGGAAVLAFAVGLLAWAAWRRDVRPVLLAVLAVAVTDPLCSRVLKPFADRERPCHALDAVALVGPCGSGRSMPSSHAANTAAVAAALASPAAAGVAFVAGTSRVVLGQHYPSDVVAGWLVGAAVGAGLRWGVRRRFGWR